MISHDQQACHLSSPRSLVFRVVKTWLCRMKTEFPSFPCGPTELGDPTLVNEMRAASKGEGWRSVMVKRHQTHQCSGCVYEGVPGKASLSTEKPSPECGCHQSLDEGPRLNREEKAGGAPASVSLRLLTEVAT